MIQYLGIASDYTSFEDQLINFCIYRVFKKILKHASLGISLFVIGPQRGVQLSLEMIMSLHVNATI